MSAEDSGVTVTWSDKYNRNGGYSPLKLSSKKYQEALAGFSSGEWTMGRTAAAIIDALFDRDFNPSGEHWDRNGSSVHLIKTHESGAESYDAKSTADWDWKDISAQAKSHAVITLSFDRKRIRLDNYSYYCAG